MAEILLYGVVGDDWAGLDAATLVPLISACDGDLDLRINSPGGYVMEGLAIVNAIARLKQSGKKVTCHIDGLAASMASVIAVAGTDVVMADNALLMIHNPWTVAYGDAAELRKEADQLDVLRDQIVKLYAARTGLTAEQLVPMLDAETWLTSEQALEQKFVTSIAVALPAVAASFVKPFGFKHAPQSSLISAVAMTRTPRTTDVAPQPQKETAMSVQDKSKSADHKIADTVTADQAKAQAEAAVTAERTRASTIRQAVAKAKLPATYAEELVDAGTSIDESRAKIIDKLADANDATTPRNQAPIQVGTEAREKWLVGARNALLARAGLTKLVAQAAAKRKETIDLDPGELRGIRNVELARMSLDMAGINCRSYDRERIVGDALVARNAITQTTSDFPLLLENVMHKILQAAYAVAPDSWSRVCGIGSVTDFRPHNRYLRGTFGALDRVNEAGEFKNKPIPDAAKELISALTKGNIIALSRQAIVNDDMDAFSGLAVDLGRAAKLSIEIDFYALLALNAGLGPVMNDGNTLFHATHGNIPTAAAPSVAAFDALRVLMARQKDVSGNEFLDIRPSVGLFPVELGGTARTINDAQYDPDTVNKLQRPNMVRGLFSDIVDTPRLSGTPWYGFADPSVAPAIEVVFLNGEQEPFLDTQEGWRVDGTEMKVRHDYGVGAVNWRSAARNAGQ